MNEEELKEHMKLLKKFLIPVLRRATYRFVLRTEALKEARVERGLYRCAMCEELFKNKDICIDHVNPVIDVTEGFKDWQTYILRMFPPKKGWQILCKNCHDIKTMMEDEIRKLSNKKRKELDKANK